MEGNFPRNTSRDIILKCFVEKKNAVYKRKQEIATKQR